MAFVTSSGGDAGYVLVAETHPVIAGALSWLLREQGYAVAAVGDRDALFATISRSVPDLILLDGESSGRLHDSEILDQLRGDARWHDVRVIVTAPWAAVEEGSGVLPWGADDCVSKPFRVPELLGRVRTQLRASSQLREARSALAETAAELDRAREDALSNRRLVDILHEVTGEVSPMEIYRILARRVSRSIEVSHCSVVLARAGDAIGTVAATAEDPAMADVDLTLDEFPEIGAALDSGRTVLASGAADDLPGPTHHNAPPLKLAGPRSVAAIPFAVDRWRSGVLLLRTARGERMLTREDVEFADIVVRAAVAAIRRAQALETTRADNRRLEALATTDPLTRILNRRALLDRLTSEMDRARRFDSSLCLLLLDVDHFKNINDTVGHLAGDRVLRQIAALLEDAARKVDVVARYGGEEFVAILPETSVEGATIFAERLRERIALHEFDLGADDPAHLTVSIGIASFPSLRVASTEDLFARADEALYRAKSGGRNQVCA